MESKNPSFWETAIAFVVVLALISIVVFSLGALNVSADAPYPAPENAGPADPAYPAPEMSTPPVVDIGDALAVAPSPVATNSVAAAEVPVVEPTRVEHQDHPVSGAPSATARPAKRIIAALKQIGI